MLKAVANRDPKPIREPEKRGRPGLDTVASQGLAGLLGLSSAGTMNNSNDKLAKNANALGRT